MEPFNPEVYPIPDEFKTVLKEWTREVLRFNPDDIIAFSRDYFASQKNGSTEQFLAKQIPNGTRVPEQQTNAYYPREVNNLDSDKRNEEEGY